MVPHLRRACAVMLTLGAGLGISQAETKPAGDPVAVCTQIASTPQPFVNLESHSDALLSPGRKQLFLDGSAVQQVDDLSWKLHQPEKFGAVIRPDRPWEGHAIQIRSAPVWSTEDKAWKIWYFSENRLTGIALSKDGVHWDKPDLGLVEYSGIKSNNIVALQQTVSSPEKPMEMMMNVVYDPDDPDPARRYKAFLGTEDRRPVVSKDGLNWTLLAVPPIASDDESSLYHDRENRLFIATVKHPGPYGRSVYLSLSRDFEHWTDSRDCLVVHADWHDQELGRQRILARFASSTLQAPEYNIPETYNIDVYNMALTRYQGVYLGLPAMFHRTGMVGNDWPGFDERHLSSAILKDVRQYGDWTGFHQLELISSHDLIHWQHIGMREPFLDDSPKSPDAYDLQTIMPSSPVVREGELWFYYTGIRRYAIISEELPDNSAVCLAKLRLDGFVSLRAADRRGSALTKPFVVGGKTLHINADAPAGEIRVEVLDATTNRVLPGFSVQDCISLTGNSLDSAVRWKNAQFSSLKDRMVYFRFELRNADLYAFWTI